MARKKPSHQLLGGDVSARLDGKRKMARDLPPPKSKPFKPYVWRDSNRVKDEEQR